MLQEQSLCLVEQTHQQRATARSVMHSVEWAPVLLYAMHRCVPIWTFRHPRVPAHSKTRLCPDTVKKTDALRQLNHASVLKAKF